MEVFMRLATENLRNGIVAAQMERVECSADVSGTRNALEAFRDLLAVKIQAVGDAAIERNRGEMRAAAKFALHPSSYCGKQRRRRSHEAEQAVICADRAYFVVI